MVIKFNIIRLECNCSSKYYFESGWIIGLRSRNTIPSGRIIGLYSRNAISSYSEADKLSPVRLRLQDWNATVARNTISRPDE